ncbi:MAG TPA: hypothetical protein VMK12_16180 [Anaeromyxobacteraceae bacterium]|nr:hypothetical protein [Anaeromyxobacteraceae bacterium]
MGDGISFIDVSSNEYHVRRICSEQLIGLPNLHGDERADIRAVSVNEAQYDDFSPGSREVKRLPVLVGQGEVRSGHRVLHDVVYQAGGRLLGTAGPQAERSGIRTMSTAAPTELSFYLP